MKKLSREEAISRIENGLKCSREEAEKVYEYDCAVEHDEKTEYDLSPEKLKIAQKQAHTGTRKVPTTYNFPKKGKKPDEAKKMLILTIFNLLKEYSKLDLKEINIINEEKEILFQLNNEKFGLTLVRKQTKK